MGNNLGRGPEGAGPESGETNVRRLQKQVESYKKLLSESEKERANLKTRVTMAETQARAL